MDIDTLHRITALPKLGAVVSMIPKPMHEIVITVDTVDTFGTKKTGEELCNEVRRKALERIWEEMI